MGVLQSDDGVGAELLTRYLTESRTLPGEISLSDPNNNINQDSFNPLSFVEDPSAPNVDFFADSEFETTNTAFEFQHHAPPPQTISPAAFAGSGFTGTAAFTGSADFASPSIERPTSAFSHRSHHSNYSLSSTEGSGSYVTTDDDGDDTMNQPLSAAASPSPLNELGALNLGSSAPTWNVGNSNGVQTIAPTAQALGSSSRNVPPAPSSTASSSRRRSHSVSFPEGEEDKRLARLERELIRAASANIRPSLD